MTIMELAAEIRRRLEQDDLDGCYERECEIMRSVPQNEGEEAVLIGLCKSRLDSIVNNDYPERAAEADEARNALSRVLAGMAARTGVDPAALVGGWWRN